MSEDYLWDRSGEPDPEIAELERTLEPLKFEGLPLIAIEAQDTNARPEPSPVRRWWPAAVTAAAAVAAALLIWWWGFATGRDTPATVVVERAVHAPPPVIVAAPPATAGGDDDKNQDRDEDEDEDEAGDKAEDKDANGSKVSSKGSRKGARKAKASSKSGLPDIPSSSSSSSKGSDAVGVDCILDPSKCGKGGGSKSKPKKAEGATDPNLPEKLSTSDIKAGIAPVKAAAKSCGGKHGAKPGTKVKVKIAISGKTGTVTSAAAQAPHNGTPLGNCAASALKKAKFKKFRKPSLGAVYPISM